VAQLKDSVANEKTRLMSAQSSEMREIMSMLDVRTPREECVQIQCAFLNFRIPVTLAALG
jgi:hypothetical protein